MHFSITSYTGFPPNSQTATTSHKTLSCYLTQLKFYTCTKPHPSRYPVNHAHRQQQRSKTETCAFVYSFSLRISSRSLASTYAEWPHMRLGAYHPYWPQFLPKALQGTESLQHNLQKRVQSIHLFQSREKSSLMSTGFGSVPKRAE